MIPRDAALRLADLRTQLTVAEKSVRDDRQQLYAAEDRLEDLRQAQALIQEVAVDVQQQVHDRIAGVVTRCLREVFGPDAYEFRLMFEEKRGRTECRPVFVRDGHEVNPLRGAGGGAADVAAFGLRLACLALQPHLRQLLVMDEPLKNLNGAAYQDRVRALVEELARDFGIQFIIVSDDEWLQVGTVHDLG